jgi:uncharacterized membrane protein YgcG
MGGPTGGSFVTGAAPILWDDGHAEIFATDASGAAWHAWSGTGTGFTNGWHAWASLGGELASRPVPVRWADGHLEVFATGADGQLYHAAYANAAWPAFSVISPGSTIAGEPSAIMNPAGNGATTGPEVFARTPDGKVVRTAWDGTSFSTLAPHFDQATASDPFAWIREDGAAEVFTIDPTGVLTRSYHDPSSGWGAWAPIGGTDLDACLPATSAKDGGAGGSGTSSSSSGSSGGASSVGGGGVTSGKHGGCACRMESRGDGDASALVAAFAILGSCAARRRRWGKRSFA